MEHEVPSGNEKSIKIRALQRTQSTKRMIHRNIRHEAASLPASLKRWHPEALKSDHSYGKEGYSDMNNEELM